MEQEFHGSPGSRSVDRAAALLVGVLEAGEPLTAGDLARRAELPKSTASRLLSALERNGLVEQEGSRGQFRPGPVLVRFAHRGLVDRTLIELAQEPLHALAKLSGETVNLAVAGPLGVEHLAQADGEHFLGAGGWVGRRVPFHCSANGKALLAFGAAALPQGEPLERRTPATIVDPAQLERELEDVRQRGFAMAVDELEPGLSAVAAPVFTEAGRAVAALSLTGPTLRLSEGRVAELRPALIERAAALSARLGHGNEEVRAA